MALRLKNLGHCLLCSSPKGAVGYRLRLLVGSEVVCYPSLVRRSLRWDGCYHARPYFELRPHFEAPRVPIVTNYVLSFVNRDYDELPLPSRGDRNVFVQLASAMCLPGRKSISRRRPRGFG